MTVPARKVCSQEDESRLIKMLTSKGFENVRLKSGKDTLFISYESNNYRWDVRGLKVFIDSVTNFVDSPKQLEIVTLTGGIPVFGTSISTSDWKAYQNDSISRDELFKRVHTSYNIEKSWGQLKGLKPSNRDLYKVDLVIYPILTFMNITFERLYEVMFDLAPALEFSLWKGNKFTAQVIFPLYVDNIYYTQYDSIDIQNNKLYKPSIRPGYFTMSQKFRLPGPVFTTVTIGKFNQDKYGIDLDAFYPFRDPHWSIGLNVGYTGRTYFSYRDHIQYLRRGLYANYLARVGYFLPKYNLQFDLMGGKFIYGDWGVRFDATRHFGETAIGIYLVYAGGVPNGGFHFAIPLPPSKRSRRHAFRVLPPRYYELQYNGNTVFLKGHNYLTSPASNRSEDFFNPLYIKNSLH